MEDERIDDILDGSLAAGRPAEGFGIPDSLHGLRIAFVAIAMITLVGAIIRWGSTGWSAYNIETGLALLLIITNALPVVVCGMLFVGRHHALLAIPLAYLGFLLASTVLGTISELMVNGSWNMGYLESALIAGLVAAAVAAVYYAYQRDTPRYYGVGRAFARNYVMIGASLGFLFFGLAHYILAANF